MNELVPIKAQEPGVVPLLIAKRFDPANAQLLELREGLTLAEMVQPALADLTPRQKREAMVEIISRDGERLIPQELWAYTVPHAGETVRLRWPLKGRTVLRAVLMIAVIAAAMFLGPLAAGAMGFATTGFAAGIMTGLIGGVGQMLVNALIPIKPPKQRNPDEKYSISSIRNEVRPYESVPDIHGRIRHYPPMLALPYTEKVGEDVFFRCLFLDGLGEFTKEDFKIGDTPLSEYPDVDMEEVTLAPGDPPSRLFPWAVFEDQLNIELIQSEGWATQDTASNVVEVTFDWTFDRGLFRTSKKGKVRSEDVRWEYRIRNLDVPASPWTTYPLVEIRDDTDESFHVTRRVTFDTPARYRAQCRRYSEDEGKNSRSVDKFRWSALRGFRPVFTAAFSVPVKVTALRIRASKRLSGMIETFNYVAHAVRREWDAPTQSWIVRPTQSPASSYLHALQGPGNLFPTPDEEIDWPALQDWSEWCRLKNLKFNHVFDRKQSLGEALKDCCRPGRAFPTRENGMRSICIDRPQTVIRGHVTARNATKFAGDPTFADPPYAIRAKFLDETDDFKPQGERFVLNPDGGGKPTDILVREYIGETHPDQVMRSVLRDFAIIKHRWEPLYASQGWQEQLAPRGSLVIYQMPFVQELKSARVRAVAGGLVVIDEMVEMKAGGRYGCRFQLSDGSSLFREVECQPGFRMALRPLGDGDWPDAGDLALFGPFTEVGTEVVVGAKERQPDLRARITFHAHAPEIEAAADEVTLPPWFPIVPEANPWAGRKPAPPVILSVTSSVPEDDDDDGVEDDDPIVVVRLRAGDDVPVDTYDIRINGDTYSRSAASGQTSFSNFDVGDNLTITAVSVPYAGTPKSDPSGSVSHKVRASDDPPPDVTAATVVRLSDGKRRFTFTIDPAATSTEKKDVAGYQIRARPGTGWSWRDLAPIHDGLVTATPFETSSPLTTGAHVLGVVAIDPLGQESEVPFLFAATLGPSYGPGLLLQRLEAALGWPGSITGGTVVGGELEGGASIPNALSYDTPVIDLGSDKAVTVAATAYAVSGDVASLTMRTGLAADGAPAGLAVAPGAVTARYVQISITVSNSTAKARLGELVTFVTPN